jgi:hypothetical protein
MSSSGCRNLQGRASQVFTAIAGDDHHGEQNEEEFANGFWGIVIRHSFAIVRSAARQCPFEQLLGNRGHAPISLPSWCTVLSCAWTHPRQSEPPRDCLSLGYEQNDSF